MSIPEFLTKDVFIKYNLVTGFAIVGIMVWISYLLSKHLTRGRIHGSAIAIFVAS